MPVSNRRTHSSGGHIRPARRKLVWASSQSASTVAANGKVNIDLLANLETAGASVLGCTVMRTHTRLALTSTAADAAIGVFVGYLVATAPTVTNIDPSTSFGDDWMYLTEVAPGSAKNEMINGTQLFWGEEFDIRSKRKCEELNEKYFFCLENQGTGNVAYGQFTRTLIALP